MLRRVNPTTGIAPCCARALIGLTGAVAAKKGLFEVADGGSIFLDEIGDIPPETQVRLLRVIQEREFTPLGDTSPRRVDVRIIAATNIELKDAVRQGTFREDLYYRLSVVPIELPPLRDRREDILPLAQHFIRKYNEENARNVSEQIAPEVLALLESYSWPGNVRELENAVERAVVDGGEDLLQIRERILAGARGIEPLEQPEEALSGHGERPPDAGSADHGGESINPSDLGDTVAYGGLRPLDERQVEGAGERIADRDVLLADDNFTVMRRRARAMERAQKIVEDLAKLLAP